ncbi:hypothetical protein D9M69_551470 [compost metagenome]
MVGRLELLVQASGRHVAFRVDIVPGVGRAGHEAHMAGAGLKIASAEQGRRIAIDIRARGRIVDRIVAADVADRAAQPPAAPHRAIAAEDWSAAGLVAHRLRTSTLALGAIGLGQVFEAMETAGRENDAQAMRQQAQWLVPAADTARSHLRRL